MLSCDSLTTYNQKLTSQHTGNQLWHGPCFAFAFRNQSHERRRQQHAFTRELTKPTECPSRLGRVFRLARPSLGISIFAESNGTMIISQSRTLIWHIRI
jgi:hypothetical protein